ncbi:MAG: 23S rRNA pseudouridine(955/2504/2580) synthase RluC [Hahellaceae bacterium]|nr:23S rRNA pseudouridine(955/2504/2580) synthase RluC [Hahellaceae bacterium]
MKEEKSPASGGVSFYEIDENNLGQRVDNFLLGMLKGVPRSKIYSIIRKGEVRINKGRTRAEYKLQLGDVVRVPPVRVDVSSELASVPGRVADALISAILYEDENFIVINKPAGIAVHGGSGLNFGVIEAFRAARPESKFLELVHRLDRDTSGCLMLAKKRAGLTFIHEALRTGRVKKIYHALVDGSWPSYLTQVDAPLKKNELKSGERVVKVDKEGKASLTEFRVLTRFDSVTLVQASPITGRTHQIRVHAAFKGHPILGDEKYATDEINDKLKVACVKRLMLHAAELTFSIPGEHKKVVVSAPYDDKFSKVLNALNKNMEK